MRTVVVLTATPAEQSLLADEIEAGVRHCEGRRSWYSGNLRGWSAHLVAGGLGATNTAQALTCALEMDVPSLVFQVGVGGGYPNADVCIGDVAVANEEIYGDIGVRTDSGWHSSELIGIPVWKDGQRERFNRFDLNCELVASVREIVSATAREPVVGPFVTVQECSGTDTLGVERGRRFSAVCENMEGAAAAHVSAIYQVPFLEMRGISNIVEKRNTDRWDLPLALTTVQSAALLVLEQLSL